MLPNACKPCMCAGFRVAVLESLAYVAPATPRELARVLAALQSSVMRDAAMPSHGNVISVAALGAAARLAAAFPAARATISSQPPICVSPIKICGNVRPPFDRWIISCFFFASRPALHSVISAFFCFRIFKARMQ